MDRPFLIIPECAVAAEADYLFSEDRQHLIASMSGISVGSVKIRDIQHIVKGPAGRTHNIIVKEAFGARLFSFQVSPYLNSPAFLLELHSLVILHKI